MKTELSQIPFKKGNIFSFSGRVFLLLLLASVLLTFGLGKYFTDTTENRMMANIRVLAMSQAKMIASLDGIVSSVKDKDIPKLKIIADKLNQD
ncbi:sensor histidine kinase DpiB, partial [Streptococcus danieliae]|nr:sensor histidine kinase DpiB [Streptococcus danieliae]